MNRLIVSLLFANFVCVSAHAESAVPRIPDKEARTHLLHGVDPIYPPIAKLAHVSGEVILDVTVNTEGNVTKIAVEGGPPMLQTAAFDAVRGWQFAPFQIDGKNSEAILELKLGFPTLEPRAESKVDAKVAESFFEKAQNCLDADRKQSWPKAVDVCKEAAAIATTFPEESVRHSEIQLAHERFARALVGANRLADAVSEFKLAKKLGRQYSSGWEHSYSQTLYLCAVSEEMVGDLPAADADYFASEKAYRDAIVKIPQEKESSSRGLAGVLAYHALLADAMGKPSDAANMRSEAKTLDRKVSFPATLTFPQLSEN
jgi:TonB family protein